MVNCEVAILGSGIAATTAAMRMQKIGVDFRLIHDNFAVKHRPVWISKDGTENFPETKLGMVMTESVRMLSSEADYSIAHDKDKYWIIDPRRVISAIKEKIYPNRVIETNIKKDHITVKKNGPRFEVRGLSEPINAFKVIDATGIEGKIEGVSEPNRDLLVEHVYGGSFRGSLETKEMILIFLPQGGTCWVAPSVIDGYVDAVVTAWGPKSKSAVFRESSNKRLHTLIRFLRDKKGVDISLEHPEELYKGMISAQRFNQKIPDGIFPFGETAQTSRPASQESFNRILTTGSVLQRSIIGGRSTEEYLHELKRIQLKDNFMFAGLIARILTYKEGRPGGGTINAISRVLENQPIDRRAAIGKHFENWVQYGNVDPRFIFDVILRDRELRKSLTYALGAYLVGALIGYNNLLKSAVALNDNFLHKGYFNK